MKRSIALWGGDLPAPSPRRLTAGRLSCDIEDGGLRDVRWGDVEIVRALVYLLRDQDWGSPPARLDALEIEEHANGFQIRYVADVDVGEARFRAETRISGDASGRLAFEVDGEALTPLLANRCGLIILLPADVAGLPLTVLHTSGVEESMSFPTAISPGQPSFDIRSLAFERVPGLEIACRLDAAMPHDPSGRFEMEDQRNWSDASFKVYSGSLLDPWPFRIEPGRPLRQTAIISIVDRRAVSVQAPARRPDMAARPAEFAVGPATGRRLPEIGIGWPMDDRAVTFAEDAIATLAPRHLVATVAPDDATLAARLQAIRSLAGRCGSAVQLEIVLPCTRPIAMELGDVAASCAAVGLVPAAVIGCPRPYLKSYQPTGDWPVVPDFPEVVAACRRAFPDARVGSGMHTYFTELNRRRPPTDGFDFVSHATSPIVHAADDRSVMETLETLPAITASVRRLWPGVGYRIGPSSIAMRYNPYGRDMMPNPEEVRLAMAARDARQRGLFAAAWTIGYAAAVAPAEIEMLTLHAVAGPAGVVVEPAMIPPAWRGAFLGARVHPSFHALRWLAAAQGREQLDCRCEDTRIGAVAWRTGEGCRALLANLSATPVDVVFNRFWAALALDVDSLPAALGDPAWTTRAPAPPARSIRLDAYATAALREA